VLALAVAFVGVLATLTTLVAERRRDLAIRWALGASPGLLVWTIVRQGLALTAFGLMIGLGIAGASVRVYRLSCTVSDPLIQRHSQALHCS
jgi:putative ABC transport system permease protein